MAPFCAELPAGSFQLLFGSLHSRRLTIRLYPANPNAIERILRGHVREDHLVARLQALDDFDLVHRAASELHVGPDRFAVGGQLEQADGAVLLAERRPADIDDVVELLELDRAVDAQVGTRAGGQRPVEDDVDADRAAGRLRIDAARPCP